MRDETDRFWQGLLTKLNQVDTPTELTMEEADKHMASAGRIPFSKEEIDAMVSSATAAESAPVTTPLESPARIPERRSFPARYRGLITLAAVFLGILVLYSVTARTIVFSSWQRLEFPVAMELLMSPQTEEVTRITAQGRVADFAMIGIKALQDVRGRGNELRGNAERYLDNLRQVIKSEEVLSAYDVGERMGDLADLVCDSSQPVDLRQGRLSVLVNQTRSAILALKTAQAEVDGGELSLLNRGRTIALGSLARELEY